MTIQPLTATSAAPAKWITLDEALVHRHAPRIRFDRREPFLPLAAGYTFFRRSGPSPSFPRQIVLPSRATCAIEYAVWWDWDIQHLYELEHLWVYLDDAGQIVRAEGSWHGAFKVLWDQRHEGQPPLETGRLSVYAEPGKHAFAPLPRWLLSRAQITRWACGVRAGYKGVHVSPLFAPSILPLRTPSSQALVSSYLRARAFRPSYDFSTVVDLATVTLVPWADLAAWIPQRVAWWLEVLARRQSAELPAPSFRLSVLPEG